MAFDIQDTLKRVQSYLQAQGSFGADVSVGEPKSPPTQDSNLFAAVMMQQAQVAELTLQTTIETHTLLIRVYRNMLAEPTADIEFSTARVVSDIMSDLFGDADLGGTIRNVDIGGIYGTTPSVTWAYIDLGGVMFRVADLVLPLIVDDSATTGL